MGRGRAEAGGGPGVAGPGKVRILAHLAALGSQGRVVSRAVAIRFVFGEDHCGISVDNGDKGRCGEIGEEATVIVQARDDGGLHRRDGCRVGDAAVERSGHRDN